MTDAQAKVVEKHRKQFDDIGWKVTIDEARDRVVLCGRGGPRAFRSLFIAPDGTVTSGPMA